MGHPVFLSDPYRDYTYVGCISQEYLDSVTKGSSSSESEATTPMDTQQQQGSEVVALHGRVPSGGAETPLEASLNIRYSYCVFCHISLRLCKKFEEQLPVLCATL